MGRIKHEDITPAGGVITANPINGGASYVLNDIITLTGGNNDCTVKATVVSGGGFVVVCTVETPGTGYLDGVTYNTTGGTGTGATVLVNTIGYTNFFKQLFSGGNGTFRVRLRIGGSKGSVVIRTDFESEDPKTFYAGTGLASAFIVEVNSLTPVSGFYIFPSQDFDGTISAISLRKQISAGKYGPELVTNGNFNGDTSGWN